MLAKPNPTDLVSKQGPKCAIGVYPGIRYFPDRGSVAGVFGMVGVFPECNERVTARCQLYLNGHLHPYYWYACDNPEHRRDAGVIEHLNEKGEVIRISRLLRGAWQDDPPKLGK